LKSLAEKKSPELQRRKATAEAPVEKVSVAGPMPVPAPPKKVRKKLTS
jgi:hypothetical protein